MLLAVALIGVAAPVQALTIHPAVEFTTSNVTSENNAWTLGYSFSLSAPVTVNALGYWSGGVAANHQVGIWDGGGNLLTSTTVLGSETPLGHFRWGAVSDITLGAGSYVIGGEYLSTSSVFPRDAADVTVIPEYTYGTPRWVQGTGLNFPMMSSGTTYGSNGILAVNFSATTPVPEASTSAMVLIGLGGLGAALRRSRRPAA